MLRYSRNLLDNFAYQKQNEKKKIEYSWEHGNLLNFIFGEEFVSNVSYVYPYIWGRWTAMCILKWHFLMIRRSSLKLATFTSSLVCWVLGSCPLFCLFILSFYLLTYGSMWNLIYFYLFSFFFSETGHLVHKHLVPCAFSSLILWNMKFWLVNWIC